MRTEAESSKQREFYLILITFYAVIFRTVHIPPGDGIQW